MSNTSVTANTAITSLVKVDDTKIRADGAVYCAAQCGRGCTLAEYRQTMHDAHALQQRLGPDWEVSVWDNLGWTYCATNGVASIHPPEERDPKWSCIINIPNLTGISATGGTPEEAAKNAAGLVTKSFNEMLGSFKKSMGPLLLDDADNDQGGPDQ